METSSEGSFRWVEISDQCERKRFTAFSEELADAGLANEVSFLEVSPDQFASAFDEARKEFQQIRIGGSLRELALGLVERWPSTMISLRSADAFVKERGNWWPRNFLVDGLQRMIAEEIRDLDLSGGVFVLGANADTRAIVAAFARVGLARFSISDPDEQRAKALVEEFNKTYFRAQFQSVPRHLITQLPGVHSVAVNTLKTGHDSGAIAELYYFNFLKPGGVWLDFPLGVVNEALDAEAKSVGAEMESPAGVVSRTDVEWAKSWLGPLGSSLNELRYRERLVQTFNLSNQA